MASVQTMAAKARRHWATDLPEKTRQLKAEGKFETESLAAARLAMAEIETLRQRGFQDHEAEEVALSMFILLKPEE